MAKPVAAARSSPPFPEISLRSIRATGSARDWKAALCAVGNRSLAPQRGRHAATADCRRQLQSLDRRASGGAGRRAARTSAAPARGYGRTASARPDGAVQRAASPAIRGLSINACPRRLRAWLWPIQRSGRPPQVGGASVATTDGVPAIFRGPRASSDLLPADGQSILTGDGVWAGRPRSRWAGPA